MPRPTWEEYVENGIENGCTAYCRFPPDCLTKVAQTATVLAVEVSLSTEDPSPLVVVRLDMHDAPKTYNRDTYKVYDDPLLDTALPVICSSYGMQQTQELRGFLEGHVLLVGPYRGAGHHTSQVWPGVFNLDWHSEPEPPPGSTDE